MIALLILIVAASILIYFCSSAWGMMLAARVARVGRISFGRALLVVSLCLALRALLFPIEALTSFEGPLIVGTSLVYVLGTVLIIRRLLALRFWKACLVTFLGLVFAFLIGMPMGIAVSLPTRMFVITPFKIPTSDAMAPTLVQGDRILVSKMAYRRQTPQRWDVVVFRYPPDRRRPFVKRVIGLPGESIEIRDGAILINGAKAAPPDTLTQIQWLNAGDYGKLGQPATVPSDCYFTLGDNGAASYDSRYWGFVCRLEFIGKALYVFWPPEHIGQIE